jgi:hypothetical protein
MVDCATKKISKTNSHQQPYQAPEDGTVSGKVTERNTKQAADSCHKQGGGYFFPGTSMWMIGMVMLGFMAMM